MTQEWNPLMIRAAPATICIIMVIAGTLPETAKYSRKTRNTREKYRKLMQESRGPERQQAAAMQ